MKYDGIFIAIIILPPMKNGLMEQTIILKILIGWFHTTTFGLYRYQWPLW